uniref:Protein YIPF n=1 Tax=Scleropages formosus TaxID=113540 RepID=A0A8C9TI69_SCLFO
MATPDDLRFQEFEAAADLLSADPNASTVSALSVSSTQAHGDVKLDLSEDEGGQEENSELLRGDKKTGAFWTFEYYQSFFNVDTMQVLDRIRGSEFVMWQISPDHYTTFLTSPYGMLFSCLPQFPGPFWICATLVFSMAISGNLSTFLSQMGQPQYHYRPQFHRVTIAAVAVFAYAWLVPLGVWGFLTWRQSTERQISGYSFLETVCVYGYSLFVYVPTSVSVGILWGGTVIHNREHSRFCELTLSCWPPQILWIFPGTGCAGCSLSLPCSSRVRCSFSLLAGGAG